MLPLSLKKTKTNICRKVGEGLNFVKNFGKFPGENATIFSKIAVNLMVSV